MRHSPARRIIAVMFLGFGCGLLGLIGYAYWHDYSRSRQVNGEIAQLERQIYGLEERKVELTELLRYVDSESYAERRARLEFGVARPGEKVVVVTPRVLGAASEPPTPPRGPSETGASTIRAWWAYFFQRAR